MNSTGTTSKQRVRMRLDYEGEATEGIRLVERLLLDGDVGAEELDAQTAGEAIGALELLELPWVFGEMVEAGERLAEQIHSEATRGLQEIVQNAQDQGATSIRFALRRKGGAVDLLMAHNGSPVLLRDVISMALPLLSGSRRDAEKIGRFGVGLKTLNQFGDVLQVHCPPLPGFEIHGGRVRRIEDAKAVPSFWEPSNRETLFVLRLRDDTFDLSFFKDWLEGWDASSLIFLPHLREISLVDLRARKPLVRHSVLETSRVATSLRLPRASDTERIELRDENSRRKWTLYRMRYPVARDMKRVNKAIGETVEIRIAISSPAGRGRIYAGLPLEEPCTLPFSFSAPFDVNVDRTALLARNGLNEWLIARIGDLVVAAAEDSFKKHPKNGWGWAPLQSEDAGHPGHWLWTQVHAVCTRIRKEIGARVKLELPDGMQVKLPETLVEDPSLEGLFEIDELKRLDAERLPYWVRDKAVRHPVPKRARDRQGRWRAVLGDLDGPRRLSVEESLAALEWPPEELDHDDEWLLRLLSTGIQGGAASELEDMPCIITDSGPERVAPATMLATGGLLASSLPDAGLAAELGQVLRLAPAFRARTAAAVAVRAWLIELGVLHERATDVLAINMLAAADGSEPIDLSAKPATVKRLRDAFEHLPAAEREQIGPGLGLNVLLSAYEFDRLGERLETAARPADAYVPYRIEKVEGWPTAAAKTPGLRWIHEDYAELLRADRGGGGAVRRKGALAFLRALGAAVAPRLQSGIAPNADPGAVLPLSRLTTHQNEELRELRQARTLRHDWDSRDLAAVLSNLTRERKVQDRRKRARALFQSLTRAWNQQYAAFDTATAAHHYHRWHHDGVVSATWIGRLASTPWLSTRERKFTPKPPRELALLTDASFEIEGERPEIYAYEIGPEDADSPLIEAIGIEGKPTIDTIIERLEDIRDAETSGESINPSLVSRCYRAAAAYCPGGRHEDDADASRARWRAWFGTKSGEPGLIRASGKWFSIPDVRRGAYLGNRVPWVDGNDLLWNHLDVPETDVRDCRRVLAELAAERTVDANTEILAFRRLLESSSERGVRKVLSGLSLRTHDGWSEASTLFAVRNPSLSREVGRHWPVWNSPLPIDEVLPLLPVLGVTLLPEDAFQPDVPSAAIAANDLQPEFPVVVAHLKNLLVISHPALHDGIGGSWSKLSEAGVAVGLNWSVKVRTEGRRPLRVGPPSHVFSGEPPIFCARTESDAGDRDGGGRSVAIYLLGDQAREEDRAFVALAWESAFRRREEPVVALDVDAPEPEPDSEEEGMPAYLRRRSGTRSKKRRKARPRKRAPKEQGRKLVDLETLDMSTVRATIASRNRTGTFQYPARKPLSTPKSRPASQDRRTSSHARAGDREYTAIDREDHGLAIADAYLRELLDLDLEDVRDQPNVGADAVDHAKDVWVELKVSGRDRPDVVKLERTEAERAKEKGSRYLLVIVWNLEVPRTPELLVIENPLARLDVYLQSGVRLAGLDELSQPS